jgi:hypothetical protein
MLGKIHYMCYKQIVNGAPLGLFNGIGGKYSLILIIATKCTPSFFVIKHRGQKTT